MPLTPNGRGPSTSQFSGFLSIYAYTLCHRTTKFDVATRGGGACIFGSATTPTPRDRSSRAPQFGVYLYLHPLTQNDQIRHGNMGSGVFRRSAAPLYLYKRVARFVSDSYVSCRFKKIKNRVFEQDPGFVK